MTHLKSILTPLVDLVAGIIALSALAAPPSGLVTCSNLTLDVNGVPLWVENLSKACPPDAPDWFRYNTSNNLAVNIASFTCTNASTLSLHLEKPVKSLTVRPKSLRIAVTGKDRDWSLALPGPCKLYVEAESFPPLLVFADPPEVDPSPNPAKTRIFGPGVHRPGLITLEDNAQVYLAPGAVVYGGFRGKPKNARGATKAGQHSAFSIICDGPATVRKVTFEDIRVEENITRMFELNVTDGNFYSQAPPGRIQGVQLKNVAWEKACPILITGHNAEHLVDDVVFEGCQVAGVPLSAAQIQTNAFTRGIVVR